MPAKQCQIFLGLSCIVAPGLWNLVQNGVGDLGHLDASVMVYGMIILTLGLLRQDERATQSERFELFLVSQPAVVLSGVLLMGITGFELAPQIRSTVILISLFVGVLASCNPTLRVNVLLTYILTVSITFYFDYRKQTPLLLYQELKQRENVARNNDNVFLKSCALPETFQPFFPALLIRDPRFSKLAAKYRFLPLNNITKSNVYCCNEGDGPQLHSTDRYGFNNNDEVWDEPVTTLVIGDSFVEGANVNRDHNIVGQIRRHSNRNVINLGVASGRASNYEYVLRNIMQIHSPTNVVIVFYANDNSTLQTFYKDEIAKHEYGNSFVPVRADSEQSFFRDVKEIIKLTPSTNCTMSEDYYLDDNERMRHLKHQIENGEMFFGRYLSMRWFKIITLDHLWQTLGNALEMLSDSSQGPISNEAKAEIVSLLRLSKSVCLEQCRLTFVFIPNHELLRPDWRSKRFFKFIHAEVREIVDHNATILDFSTKLDTRGFSDYAATGPHLSRIGYAKVANGILDALAINPNDFVDAF